MNGSKFIAIEGADGAGKSTQIKLLTEQLNKNGFETQFIHFPRTESGFFGELIAKFLRGEFGKIDEVHPQLVALIFAEDRKEFAPQINQWLDDGCFVLVDRYVYSNIAYQCAKIENADEKLALKDWILNLEFVHYKIPRPDLSIYLDVPLNFTKSSLGSNRQGEDRSYLKGKTDIHEKSLGFQSAVKSEYENLVKSEKDFQRIKCYDDSGEIKSIQDIHEMIMKLV